MTITLYHHPHSRAAGVVWMLEELGTPYALEFVDLRAGEQKGEAFKKLNTMGKVPTVVDGEVVLSESAAIGLYLADRYSLGELAPALDDPARAPYLRWAFYGPSVIEPNCAAKAAGWEYRPSSVGWGTHEELLETLSAALSGGPYLLGERFTMADIIIGGTVGWMVMFKMLEARPEYVAYIERLKARPARQRADAVNAKVVEERGLGG